MLRREAAGWLARLQSKRDPATDANFSAWYADPRHAAAFERVRGSYQAAGLLRQSRAFGPGAGETERPAEPPRPGFAYATAAALAAAAIAVGLVLARGPWSVRETEAVMLQTNIGEIRQVALADGSTVILDSASRVEVELARGHRKARVRFGRARFQIAGGDGPFVVAAGDETLASAGGTIDVERQDRASRVDVLAGGAEVRAGRAPGLALGAGAGALSSEGGLQSYRVPVRPDWTNGMLQFDGTPLAAVAALANHYSDQRLIVDADLGRLKVSGAFRAGDTAGLARALAAAFGLSAAQGTDGNWRLTRKAALPQ